LKKAQEAKVAADNALSEANRERTAAECARNETVKAEERQKKESQQRQDAVSKMFVAKSEELRTKKRYKALFIGIVIFTITIAIMNAYSRRIVLGECWQWFVDRFGNIQSFFEGLESFVEGISGFSAGLFRIHSAWGYLIALAVLVAIGSGLAYGVVWFILWFRDKVRYVKNMYDDGGYKVILTVSMAISLLYVCLYLYEPIKGVVPLNIFSVWLLLSVIGAVAVNFKEIFLGWKN
jgi:hypothetical protein